MQLKHFLFAILIILFSPAMGQDTVPVISGNHSNASLAEIIQALKEDNDLHFYYEEEWITATRCSVHFDSIPVNHALRILELRTGVQFLELNPHTWVIIPDKLSGRREQVSPTGMIQIGLPGEQVRNSEPTLTGVVLDGSTGEGIAGASIIVRETGKGSTTEKNGAYSITLPTGTYHLKFTSVGFLDSEKWVKIYSDGELNVELFQKIIALEEVGISAARTGNMVSSLQMGSTTISLERFKQMPALMGESDVIRSVLSLPGITSSGEAASGISVRGGNPDQNLFLVDGVPLFNINHVFGFFSAVNPEMVEEITLYKGNIPSSHGGRLSSLVDISLADQLTDKGEVTGSIGMLAARMRLGIPIVKEKSTLYLSGRASYADWILNRIQIDALENSGAGFYDLNMKYIQKVGDKGTLKAGAYSSQDHISFAGESDHAYGTDFVNFEFNRFKNSRIKNTTRLFYTNYSTELSEFTDSLNSSKFSSGIELLSGSYDFSFFPNNAHKFHAGMSSLYYHFRPGSKVPLDAISQITSGSLQDMYALETALFAGHEYNLNAGFSLSWGLRFSLFHQLGPINVFSYQEGLPRSEHTIVDTIGYNKWESLKDYTSLEPRLTVKYQLSPELSLKGSYSRTKQFIHLFSNTSAITPTDFWLPSGQVIPPQTGDQFSVGLFSFLDGYGLESSVEFYYRTILDIMDVQGGAEILMNELLETSLLSGRGKAYGTEIFIRKTGRTNGWISYTYSRSERKVEDPIQGKRINFGNWYPSDYDRPHDIKVFLNHKFSSRFSASANFIFSSGRPATFPVGYYLSENIPVVEYSLKNQYRLPDYKRIDLSINMDLTTKKVTMWKSGLSFSLYNLLGWDNTYSVFFRNEGDLELKAYQVLMINQVVPALSYYFKF